ncbi:TRAP transporter large permease [Bacillus sp. H-16]|uniref:TRAP transporter large permease n=1 Tax=Alteribacter salitolerans TaxID=2912333 RepID=UPI001963C0F9|nr:TRAP transporter large permease [Alteribacter salitolerans]MBM7097645.1 TRAP transporter large permease [Alteribacter salitolerans]
MDPLIILLLSFFVLIILRVPIAFALGLSSMLTIYTLGLPFTTIVNQMYSSVNSFPLLAVPLFLLLGRLMNDGGITDRLVNLSSSLVGHIRGGLGHINVTVSMMFAGLSGSAAADTAGVGAMMIPAMKKAKFDPAFAVALTAVSSTLGVIIPPSILMVIYGAVAQVSIGALFLAGVVPGILIAVMQMVYTYVLAVRKGFPASPKTSVRQKGMDLWKALPVLLLPIIIIAGITGGIFTATEAAAVAVAYGFILMIFYRSINFRKLPGILADSVVNYSLPMMAVASAGIMGWLIAMLGAPEIIAGFITGITTNQTAVYLLIVLFLLVIGTFLSPVTSVIIFMPIIQELGQVAGAHPLHLGIIVILTLSLGMVTPPYGICLLIATQIGEVSTPKAFLAILPLIGITLGIIIIGLLVPDLFMFLPRMLMPDVVVY